MPQDLLGFAELFLNQEVEVQLLNVTASTPVPGLALPNEGVLIAYDTNGVVLKKGGRAKGNDDGLYFFPYATIRLIRRKAAATASLPTPPPMARKTGT